MIGEHRARRHKSTGIISNCRGLREGVEGDYMIRILILGDGGLK
jgi:hypothetical protein